MRVIGIAFAVTAGLTATAAAQSPRDLIARALEAMGGEPAVRALQSTTAEYYVSTFALGQSETPESPPRASTAAGRVTTDSRAMRRARSQEPRAVTGVVQRTRRITAGAIGMLETDGRQAPDGAAAVDAVLRFMRRDPERLLIAALDHPEALSALPPARWRGELHDALRYANGPDTLTLSFNRYDGLLTVVEAVTPDPILGDRHTTTWYTRWQDAGGVHLPRQVDVMANSMLQEHWVFTSVTANTPLDEAAFTIPDSISARAPRAPAGPPPAILVRMAELAPGVWRAEGGTHHSLVVEQPNQIVIVEAPQSFARTRAVLDTVRARFRGKPVGAVVNTHHHWDHSGGIRAVIAAGHTLVTHPRNEAFVRGVATARRTLEPDEQSRLRRAPRLQLVADSLVIGTGDSRVVVYALPTAHVEGNLAAYVPAARVLFTSDVLPGAPAPAPLGSREVVAAARRWGITIDRVAGGHGSVLAWADVERAATR